MKKIIFFLFIIGFITCASAAFAQTTAAEIIVQTVTGKVEYEVSAGKWEAVTANMKLSPSTVINTGLNSTLILRMGDRVVTIRAMQKGTVEKLTSALISASGGITVGAKAADSSVNTGSTQGRSNISTASTRASEATEDLEWVDEEE